MNDRRKRVVKRQAKRPGKSAQPAALAERDPAQRAAWFEQAGAIMADEALPGIEAFRAYMAAQQRKLEVAPFLDHIEGPQIVVHISRPDGRITATLIAEVTADGIQPSWDVRSTGRVKTHWVEKIADGPAGLTRDHVLQKLTELYATDFS
jgi:hypothetical protein